MFKDKKISIVIAITFILSVYVGYNFVLNTLDDYYITISRESLNTLKVNTIFEQAKTSAYIACRPDILAIPKNMPTEGRSLKDKVIQTKIDLDEFWYSSDIKFIFIYKHEQFLRERKIFRVFRIDNHTESKFLIQGSPISAYTLDDLQKEESQRPKYRSIVCTKLNSNSQFNPPKSNLNEVND